MRNVRLTVRGWAGATEKIVIFVRASEKAPRTRMEAITQFLIDWGYWGLFLSALIAGNPPFSSEAVMGYCCRHGHPVWCRSSRRAGQYIGGMTCYWIGTLGKTEWITRLYV